MHLSNRLPVKVFFSFRYFLGCSDKLCANPANRQRMVYNLEFFVKAIMLNSCLLFVPELGLHQNTLTVIPNSFKVGKISHYAHMIDRIFSDMSYCT